MQQKEVFSLSLMTHKEIRDVNKVIIPKFGVNNELASGSFELMDDGKRRYNIVLVDLKAYKPTELLRAIGKYAKEILDADEIYYFGHKIA